jgi:pyruvate/2-oxoglutarate dehydrogenase complex dihydrolipoamide acyltransferase (E2) component
MNALLIKAMLYGIRRVPLANSCVIGDAIEIYNDVHVGFAVSVPGKTQFDSGLIVPVIRNANQYGLIELNEKIKEIVIRAKAGECTQDDFVGSTITFSTTAGLAPPGHRSTPVLNLPNAMLIGPSTPIEKPWNVNGEVKLQTILPISVTFDHRVLDGDPAVRFMSAMNEAIENPALLLSV